MAGTPGLHRALFLLRLAQHVMMRRACGAHGTEIPLPVPLRRGPGASPRRAIAMVRRCVAELLLYFEGQVHVIELVRRYLGDLIARGIHSRPRR